MSRNLIGVSSSYEEFTKKDQGFTVLVDNNAILKHKSDLSVLFVEDNTHTRESLLFLLKLYFNDVDVAFDGAEGLQKYQEYFEGTGRYYDIVMTDIYMPNLSGIQMIRKMLDENTRQQFVVVSADNKANDLIKLINLGISNFLLKPISADNFKMMMARVIQASLDQRTLYEQYTEIKKINSELALAKKYAEEASRLKSEFLANMSHEIRTPLNAINGFISLLKSKEDDPVKKRYIDIIDESSKTLLQIINDVLDISKIENGKLDIEAADFDPYHDLILVTELFQARAAEKDIDLRIQYPHSIPKCLNSDVLRIKQVISNLLSNAIKFTPEGGKIKCILWYNSGYLYVKVKDYGIGIAKKKQEHIFEAFAQEDSSTVREYGGTGLGLSISYRLSKLLGGDLSVVSEKGKGSVFTFSARVQSCATALKTVESTSERSTAEIAGKRILLVEDNKANQLFMKILLNGLDLEVDIASDGLEAVQKVKDKVFDLILMDENMPNLNGTGAAKAIRAFEKVSARARTPIISLTANAIKGDRERFLEAGMDDYIAKPIEKKTLMKKIRTYLE